MASHSGYWATGQSLELTASHELLAVSGSADRHFAAPGYTSAQNKFSRLVRNHTEGLDLTLVTDTLRLIWMAGPLGLMASRTD